MDVSGVVGKLLAQVGEILSSILNFFIGLLPDSPFVMIESSVMAPIIRQLNWIIPFDFAVGVLSLWMVAVGSYYVCSVVLRWLKAIE